MYYKKQKSDKPLLLIMRIPWFGLLCALKRFILLLYVYTFHTVSRQARGGLVLHIMLPEPAHFIGIVIRIRFELFCVINSSQLIMLDNNVFMSVQLVLQDF